MREVQSPKRESARHSTHDVKIDPHPPFDTLKIFEQPREFSRPSFKGGSLTLMFMNRSINI